MWNQVLAGWEGGDHLVSLDSHLGWGLLQSSALSNWRMFPFWIANSFSTLAYFVWFPLLRFLHVHCAEDCIWINFWIFSRCFLEEFSDVLALTVDFLDIGSLETVLRWSHWDDYSFYVSSGFNQVWGPTRPSPFWVVVTCSRTTGGSDLELNGLYLQCNKFLPVMCSPFLDFNSGTTTSLDVLTSALAWPS